MDPQAEATHLDATVAQAAAGDPAAWRGLVAAYGPRVFALLVRQCGDRDLAEELTQATFVKVVTHIGGYSERGRFEPWLFRIAMNRLRDEMRRRRRQAMPMDMSGGADGEKASAWAMAEDQIVDRTGNTRTQTPLESASRAEEVERVRAAVDQLGEADREVLTLRHTAGLSFAQIAETLGEPLGTVLARAHRALAKLKKLLEQRQEEQDRAADRANAARRATT